MLSPLSGISSAEAVVRILDAEGCIYNAYTPDGVFTNLRADAEGAERFRQQRVQ